MEKKKQIEKRKVIRPAGRKQCNDQLGGKFWCDRRQWFMAEPCHFENKQECRNYRQLCGEW